MSATLAGGMIFPGRCWWLPKALATFANVVWPHWSSHHKRLSLISYYTQLRQRIYTRHQESRNWIITFGSIQFHLILPCFKPPLQINIVLIWWSVRVIGNCSSPLLGNLYVSHGLRWPNLSEVFLLGFLDFCRLWSDPQCLFLAFWNLWVSECVLAMG